MKKKIFIFIFLMLFIPITKAHAADVKYQTHVQDYGWLSEVSNGELGGTTGQAKRMEALKISLDNAEYEGSIVYQTHVQDYGWLSEVSNGELGGTTGQAKRAESIKIKLTGEIANHYDLLYRSHVEDIGWMDWVKNGELCGTTGQAKRMEAIEIKLVSKEEPAITFEVASHNRNGWTDYKPNGEIIGTTGQGIKMDKFVLKLTNETNISGSIKYQIYNYDKGWQEEKNSGEAAGTENEDIEAVKIYLTDELADLYNIFYRVHVSDIGWMDYTSNGEIAGTVGYFNKIEAMEVILQPKNNSTITIGNDHYRESINEVNYSAHVSNIGWMDYVNDNNISGTTGRGLKLEAFKLKLNSKLSGNVIYKAYIAKKGWLSEVSNDQLAGTTGLSRSMEIISIKLTGEVSNKYDIYYRVHVSNIGWMSWAKNGEKAGCGDSGQAIEAIQIKLVKKNSTFQEDTSKPFVEGRWAGDHYYDYFGRMATGFKIVEGVKCFFNEEGVLYGRNVKKTIDVSSWQDDIDWDTIKRDDDVDMAILRIGYGSSYGEDCGLDSRFDRNINAVRRLNIPYQIYIYGYAENATVARQEADFVADVMDRYGLPKDTMVWYDAEISWFPRSAYEQIVPSFLNRIKERGYNNYGLYSGVRQLDTYNGNLNTEALRSYKIWVAQYYKNLQYTGEYVGWQYSSTEYINGINGCVDVSMFK